jgi:hypothetical protein
VSVYARLLLEGGLRQTASASSHVVRRRILTCHMRRRTEADCVSIIAYVPRVSASSNIIVDEGLQRTLDL